MPAHLGGQAVPIDEAAEAVMQALSQEPPVAVPETDL